MALRPVIMPKLGAYTEDVLLLEWRAQDGAEVREGDVLFVLETDKTTAEVEAEVSGWLHRTVAEGVKVPIGANVGAVATTRAEYEALGAGSAMPVPVAVAAPIEEPANPFLGYIDEGGGVAAALRSGAPAPEAVVTSVPGVRSRTPATNRKSTRLVSPRARAYLARNGVLLEALGELPGTGPGGRIVERDVVAWVVASAPPAGPLAQSGRSPSVVASRIPLRGRRGTIASRMVSSLQNSAQLTSVLELDVKPLVDLRSRLNAAGASPRVGVTAIMVKLLGCALREHPILNSHIEGDEVEILVDVNIAVAVDTPDGVVAPVVHEADRLSLEETNLKIADLAQRARSGSLTRTDVADGTFTISNGGIYPVDITTAILNPPQTGLLWIGRIRDRPVVVGDGAIAVRPTIQACLTFDHRAVDGGPAAEFLATLERLVAALPDALA